ncbi:type II secretion system F family protein [Actinocorallia sp. A-T 12471]|uniref:type II secretion system F family protein n=1 Tax=Actinocorallia sp. A-T 12471 TaxID=3089813 RepID=UPI0029CE563F|nr:type II secretion system F family protein [Actinocorallia sp. A-T 12471]MDX6742560.1 type II secretion system F family protein [Actinocorallia sp. A-T 12471]
MWVGGRRAARRLERATRGEAEGAQGRAEGAMLGVVLCGGVGVGVWVFFGGIGGVLPGVAAAVWCRWWWARREPSEVGRRRQRLQSDLPVAVELLAACLGAGVAWADAVEAVGEALGGPVGEEFEAVAARVRLGADPADAWAARASDPVLAPLARAAARAGRGGAPLAPVLTRLSRDQRSAAAAAAEERARAAGVKAVAPLGLCFLPAFVLLGIVPAIAGIARGITLP